jgi:protein-tyrosine phosphatase
MRKIGSVLVVCDGNHCRSPLGEVLLRHAAGGALAVSSAGLSALEGVPADAEAQRLAAEHGFDLAAHRGRQITAGMASAADLILVMDERQKHDCTRLAPKGDGKILLLGQWRPAGAREIPDPFRQSAEIFRAVYQQISQSVQDWLPYLVSAKRHS